MPEPTVEPTTASSVFEQESAMYEETRRARAWAAEYTLVVAENERRERQTAALYELWRSVPHTDTNRLLQRIAERATAALDGHSCSLLLRERGGDTLRVAASVGLAQDVVESVTVLVGERIAGRVAATGQPILVNKDPRNHPLLRNGADAPADIARRPEVDSAICSPLIGADGDIVGVLCMSRFAPASAFTESDLRVVSLFAALAGSAIAHARTVEDLTRAAEESAHLEREMARTTRLAALGQLAATVAHELRNPLSSIKGAAQFLLRECETPSKAHDGAMWRDFLSIVVEEVDGLGRLTTDLLDFAGPTESVRNRHDLRDIISGEAEFLRPALAALGVERLTFVDADFSPAFAEVDAAQIGQALRNLLLNAAQATQTGDCAGDITVTLRQNGNVYEIGVCDNGPGVLPQARERLWEPFFTTKARGSGLGLSQVRRVAEAHGGQADLRDAAGGRDSFGGGACFVLQIPAGTEPEGKSTENTDVKQAQ